MRVASRHAPCCNMKDARTSLVGSSRYRSEVRRSEEEEVLGGGRGKGKAVPSKNTWVGAAETHGQEGLSFSSLASHPRPPPVLSPSSSTLLCTHKNKHRCDNTNQAGAVLLCFCSVCGRKRRISCLDADLQNFADGFNHRSFDVFEIPFPEFEPLLMRHVL
jgi:hypothetical protein